LANTLAPALGALGVDVARLPPAEDFLEETGPATLRISAAPGRIDVRGRRVLHVLAAAFPVHAALRILVGLGLADAETAR
jgi:hypothetical protein